MNTQGYMILLTVLSLDLKVQGSRVETMFPHCQAKYSDGSLSAPCTLCTVCVKKWVQDNNTSADVCFQYFYSFYSKITQTQSQFIEAFSNTKFCSARDFCHKKKEVPCRHTRKGQDGEEVRVQLLGACKCGCDSTHYGQFCHDSIPPGLTMDSFADVQNIVYVPFVYVGEFSTVYMYFLTTGANLDAEIKTRTQLLRYNQESCRTDVPTLNDMCHTLLQDSGVKGYMQVCEGGPSYEEHEEFSACAIIVNFAFTREKVTDLNVNHFLLNDDDGLGRKSDEQVLTTIETVNVKIFNRISSLSGKDLVYSNTFGITVIYSSKNSYGECKVLVTIPQYSKKSENAPSFPRSQEISLTNLVVLEKTSDCDNLGDPVTDWYVWNVQVNHDEKNNQPYHQLFQTTALVFQPFSLPFGTFKVKTNIRFVTRKLDSAFAYCYFQIVSIPLRPLIIGGSLRYVYYKSNLDLISDDLVDPNFPRNQQPDIKRFWRCDDEDDSLCDLIVAPELILTKPGPFKPNKRYNFSMLVQSPLLPTETCYQEIIFTEEPIPNLMILCLVNCGGEGFKSDPREIFYFQVKHSGLAEDKENTHYNWTYLANGTKFVDVLGIQQEEKTPSSVLVVNENMLEENTKYTFRVTGGGEPEGEAQIVVQTFKYSKDFQCLTNPVSGIAGETKFSIECNKGKFEDHDNLALNFFFYDKFHEDDDPGRLVGSNYMELIEDVVLTRGTLTILATNMYGQFQKTQVEARLKFPKLSPSFLEESIRTLYTISENEGYNQKLSFISSLCDLLSNDTSLKEQFVEKFLEVISWEKSIDLVHLELMLSATQSVICQENNCTLGNMSTTSYKYLNAILTEVSGKLAKEIQITAASSSHLPSSKLKCLQTSLLRCLGTFLSVQNRELFDGKSETIDYKIYDTYKKGNLKLLNSLEKFNEVIAVHTVPFVKHTSIQTENIGTWMKIDSPVFFANGSVGNYTGSYILMSSLLVDSLKKISSYIVVQANAFKIDPYWWSQTEHVSTEVVSLKIGYIVEGTKYFPIKSFQYPIDIYLKKLTNVNVNVSGAVTQPYSAEGIDKKDSAVNVHKIYALKGGKITVKFIDLQEHDSFRVSIMKNRRPDFDALKNADEVNYTFPLYHSTRETKIIEDNDTLFIGILPGKLVPENSTITYKFRLQSARCQVWYDFLWDSIGCYLGENSNKDFLHCQCTHLTSIAGFIGVPVNTVNPLTDYTLFLTIPDNPLVFTFVLIVLLLYLLLLIWCCRMDKNDSKKTSLIVLEDNKYTDEFGYLLVVFTGSRIFAGTTSNIGIVLHGNEAFSRSHILKSSTRKTLKRNNDDWFLLYCPKHLGIISSIHLWTDHSGTSPNWFCDRIHVHDLYSNRDYTFLIGKWFGVTQMSIRVESYAKPIQLDKEKYFGDFFLTNVVFGFRELHLWVSIFARHPRSPMSRAQRLSIAEVAVVTIILTSILFYNANMPYVEDIHMYGVSTREALISIYSIAVSLVATGVVYFAFRKSFTYVAPVVRESHQGSQGSWKQRSRVHVDSVATLRQPKLASHGFKYYIKRTVLCLRKNFFYPIIVGRNSEKLIKIRKSVLIFSWALCLSIIIVCCFFTVWLGIKIGENKSLLWLTSIAMSFVEDAIFLDPVKIIAIALLFGTVQTQLCDLYAYDPRVYKLKQSIERQLNSNQFDNNARITQYIYKPATEERLTTIIKQQDVVKKWWTLIDIIDILFSVLAIFIVIGNVIPSDYFFTNSVFTKMLFNRIDTSRSFIPSPDIKNVATYSLYLQESVFPGIYVTQWYNNDLLTDKEESFAETGWAKTIAHRMVGIPRLRQIRVIELSCNAPPLMKNLTKGCNVIYSSRTEDADDYSAQWKNYTYDYVDVVFKKSPWIYTGPDKSSFFGVFDIQMESRELFHAGGYIANLRRTRRKTVGTLLNLIDLDWLDRWTRVVFFELSTYNVNNNVFTTISFVTEHLDSSLVLAGKTVRSVKVRERNVIFEVVYSTYSVLVMMKLFMVLNTKGPKKFFRTFWTLYDLCFIIVGLIYFIANRALLKIFSDDIAEFQRIGKEDFFLFSGLFLTKYSDRFVMALIFTSSTIRVLRLLKYGARLISLKYRFTLYFSWPQILCITSLLATWMFILQRFVAYLVHCQYSLGTSHWLQHKMNFPDLWSVTVSPTTKFFVYLPCAFSCVGLLLIVMVLIDSYLRADDIYEKEKHEEEIKSLNWLKLKREEEIRSLNLVETEKRKEEIQSFNLTEINSPE